MVLSKVMISMESHIIGELQWSPLRDCDDDLVNMLLFSVFDPHRQ